MCPAGDWRGNIFFYGTKYKKVIIKSNLLKTLFNHKLLANCLFNKKLYFIIMLLTASIYIFIDRFIEIIIMNIKFKNNKFTSNIFTYILKIINIKTIFYIWNEQVVSICTFNKFIFSLAFHMLNHFVVRFTTALCVTKSYI